MPPRATIYCGTLSPNGSSSLGRGSVIVPTNSAYEEVQQEKLQASARVMVHSGLMWARAFASCVNSKDRLDFARAVVFHAVSAYWTAKQPTSGWYAPLRRLPADIAVAQVSSEARALARATGTAAFFPAATRQGQKGNRAQSYSSLRRRKPRMSSRSPGEILARCADRQNWAMRIQPPPRTTRNEPDAGPRGSVTVPPG